MLDSLRVRHDRPHAAEVAMASWDGRRDLTAGLPRRALLAGIGAAAAIPSFARASAPCPEELDRHVAMHQYRLQYQSWSGLVPRGTGTVAGQSQHFISHCVRNASSTVVFVDWKGAGLAGYADNTSPMFGYRTYSHGEFTREAAVLWYGSRPTDRDTDIAIPSRAAIGFDAPHSSTGAFNLPSEAMVRAAWSGSIGADEGLANLRARAEKTAAAEFMRVSLWFSVTVEKGDRAEAPARANYHGSCTIDTRGNALTDLFGLRIGSAAHHRAIFGSAAPRALPGGRGRVSDEFGASVDLEARTPAALLLQPARLMIVGPDGTTPIASIGIGVIA
ncbi:MAG: hypothetical protein KF889_18955 [Alphaproteobacteria bacterium]|nr:hypothetical protein [Alphaproteobacteria bacterium]MCW5744145.1 hypothetical protein [Alphaproteobacteria bacterium]